MIADALIALRPGAQWTLSGDDYPGLVWTDPSPKPTEAEITAWIAANQVRSYQVNAERDTRLRSFPFGGKIFDFCDGRGSDINIAGAGTLALGAIIEGKQAGDLRWANPDADFTWITADNSTVTMDALTCLNFAKAAAQWKERHIHAARTMKNMSPIPLDYQSNSHWPT